MTQRCECLHTKITLCRQVLDVLSGASGDTVLLLGHNPGIAEFAGNIVSRPPDHNRFFDYPTCATAVISFDIQQWSDVDWHSGEVREFVIPRELLE